MDYQVFIISRMREAYDRTGSTETAVVEGIGRTGRLVTSAALIMFLAFVAFSASPGTEAKMFATALGGGILIDATHHPRRPRPGRRRPARPLELVAPRLGRTAPARRALRSHTHRLSLTQSRKPPSRTISPRERANTSPLPRTDPRAERAPLGGRSNDQPINHTTTQKCARGMLGLAIANPHPSQPHHRSTAATENGTTSGTGTSRGNVPGRRDPQHDRRRRTSRQRRSRIREPRPLQRTAPGVTASQLHGSYAAARERYRARLVLIDQMTSARTPGKKPKP